MDLNDKNIVLAVTDTLSAFHLPFHGYERDTAPFLTRLAQDNTYVEYGYANAPWTIPAHASLFSGKLPKEHGTTSESMKFEDVSFVEQLSERGMFTLGVSNNSLISEELGFEKGFDNLVSTKMSVISRNRGWGESFQHLREMNAGDFSLPRKYIGFVRKIIEEREFRGLSGGLRYFLWRKIEGSRFPDFFGDFGSRDANGLVIDELEGEEDFFVFLNYMEPHSPYYPPEKVAEKWVDDYQKALETHDSIDFWDATFGEEVPLEDVEVIRSLYDAEVRYLDSRLKGLYTKVMEKHDDTVFVIVGDHGELLGEYGGWWDHQFGIWEKLLRVPIIIAGDGVPDTVIDKNVSLRELHDFVLGEKGLEELGSEEVFAEYYGAKGFVLDFGDRSRDEFPEEAGPYLDNESKCVIRNREGFIRNSEFPGFPFEVREDGFSEEPASFDTSELERNMDEWFGLISDIDV